MNFFGILFTLVVSGLLLRVPRNWASLPLLLGSVYITRVQTLDIGPMHFPTMRVLIAVGLLRVMMNGERISGGMNSLDRITGLWAIWNICSIAFHRSDVMVGRFGTLFEIVGAYYLFRVFIRGIDDVRTVFKITCVVLVPIAVTMLREKLSGNNPLSLIGFGPAEVVTTKGHFRAQGPFAHPILAGTVGGICLPMAIYFWRENRKLALVGLMATLGIVFASGSSGPIMTTLAALTALSLWLARGQVRTIRWVTVCLVIALSFLMNSPIYYLMGRIDITGGSTGYFRAALIQSSIDHLSEWWFAGTDHTRHWMPSGIESDVNNTDITNYFLQMGVWGGLPLMLLFVWVLVVAFRRIGKALRAYRGTPPSSQFLIWALGSILFAHTTTFFSISYYDQTVVFLCLVLACIGSLNIASRTAASISGRDLKRPEMDRTPAWSGLSFERPGPT